MKSTALPNRQIILTSFFRAREIEKDLPSSLVKDHFYSAAVYQPKTFFYKKLDFFDIRDSSGAWTRPRDFLAYDDPLAAYHDALMTLYYERLPAIQTWLRDMSKAMDALVCCWCPYDRAAQRQIKEHGSFVCHTAVMYEVLKDLGANVVLDNDRDKMVPLWDKYAGWMTPEEYPDA